MSKYIVMAGKYFFCSFFFFFVVAPFSASFLFKKYFF